jgi:hypothetical protein
MPPRDREIVRDLARRVADVASQPVQAERARLWRACNDLTPVRPMVYLDPQNGWRELEEAWVRPRCSDPFIRDVERTLLFRLARAEHLPDDCPITDVYPVHLAVSGTGYDDYGIPMEVVRTADQGGAYRIVELVKDEGDLDRLHPRPIVVDHAATDRALERTRELIGDILRVERRGKTGWRYGLTRVLVHLRGLDQMMLDFYDEPALIHRLMAFLRDDCLREIDLMERERAVSLNNGPDSGTGSGGLSHTSSLPGPSFDGLPRVRHCTCWGESQETVGVGPAQFEEFVLAYQLPLLGRFGLVDYGCCEPLDHKLDLLLAKVPNLRWVSVSPWANRALCAEKLGGRYVYVYKPNPAYLCSPEPAWEAAAEDIRRTLVLTRGRPVHIVMKDTNTFHNDPPRATRWCEMARRLAEDAG